MVRTVTRPPSRSLRSRASSRARRSSGLKTAGSALRFTVPSAFIASPVMFDQFGTCLTRTTIVKDTLPPAL